MLIPILYAKFGPGIAFGLPGVLMAIATLLFWIGRKEFIHVPASPGGKLGFLDTIVGFFLFTPLFMLLFGPKTGIDGTGERLLYSAVGLIAGFLVFSYRQRIKEDDGFLAVLIYSIKAKFVRVGHEIGKPIKSDAEAGPLANHWFFGAAAKKVWFGRCRRPLGRIPHHFGLLFGERLLDAF